MTVNGELIYICNNEHYEAVFFKMSQSAPRLYKAIDLLSQTHKSNKAK